MIGALGTEFLASSTNLQSGADLITGQDLEVLIGALGKGVSTWALSWGGLQEEPALLDENPETGVKLVVPVSASPEADATYKLELIWTLISAPEINK